MVFLNYSFNCLKFTGSLKISCLPHGIPIKNCGPNTEWSLMLPDDGFAKFSTEPATRTYNSLEKLSIATIWAHLVSHLEYLESVVEIKGHEFQVVLGHSDRYGVTFHIASLSLPAADRWTKQLNLLLTLHSWLPLVCLLSSLSFVFDTFCFSGNTKDWTKLFCRTL